MLELIFIKDDHFPNVGMFMQINTALYKAWIHLSKLLLQWKLHSKILENIRCWNKSSRSSNFQKNTMEYILTKCQKINQETDDYC